MTTSSAVTPNWDLVADVVNVSSSVFRSPKQCKNRYESTIIPREEGKLYYDVNQRKPKKTKYKVSLLDINRLCFIQKLFHCIACQRNIIYIYKNNYFESKFMFLKADSPR